MKRNGNHRKPGKKRLAFRDQAIRELRPSDFERISGAATATDPDPGMGTASLTLPFDGFLC